MTNGAMKKFKNFFKKFWFVVWKDDSFKGWIISIIFLFLAIKFIFFPLLSLITGTSLPLAIVESCSMYHEGNLFSNYDQWWQEHESQYSDLNINKQEFKKFIFKNGFNKGDILFIMGVKPKNIEVGDVIIFNALSAHPIIHRVMKVENNEGEYTFSTMGDNVGAIQFFEQKITEDQLVGKAVFKLAPYIGWGKLIFFEPGRTPFEKGFCKEK